MKRLKLPSLSFLLLVYVLASFSAAGGGSEAVGPGPASPADTNLTMYGRGLYPGDDSTYEILRKSGFTTIILSSFYIRADGDLYSGDDNKNPVIHNGEYTGNKEWLKRVASLKQKTGSVTRIEILLEGRWINQPPNTFDFIKDWSDPAKTIPGISTGTGVHSTLYKIFRVLKKEIGADAVCIDDESVYDSESILRLGKMTGKLKMHMSLCPFRNYGYWKAVIDGSKTGLVDAVYLQCYDGGRRETPGQWNDSLAANIPVYPIFLCRGAFNSCSSTHNSKSPDEIRAEMTRFKKSYPGLSGGAIWQMADVKSYIRKSCAVQTPESGNAGSVTGYLDQLRNSLKEGL